MKSIRLHTMACAVSFVLALLTGPAVGQMRPDCGTDPFKPGACFTESESFNASVTCGVPSLTENLNEGFFVWVNIQGENDFFRDNRDGTRFIHLSDDEIELAAFCPWPTALSGLCFPGSDEVFVGTIRVEANGFLTELGGGGCPFITTGSGELTRPSDGKTIQVRPTVHGVFQGGVCSLRRCDILKPDSENGAE